MKDLDFSNFNLAEEDLQGIDPNDLIIYDTPPIKPSTPTSKQPELRSDPNKFLFTAEEFLSGIVKD